eukprot:scaffold3570_cov227-Amphora_coffeaeformis.AAC.18
MKTTKRRRFSLILFPFSICLLAIAATTTRTTTHAWQPQSRPHRVVPPWSEFQFAPNGVCISPERFVVVNNDSSSSSSSTTTTNTTTQTFTMRNVPGQGDCIFQAVALASFASVGLGANHVLLRAITKELRALTATVLEQQPSSSSNKHKYLVVEGKRLVSTTALLQSAAQQEGLSTAEYLRVLRTEGVDGGLYGGGPELTVLSNLLRRPISIYELTPSSATLLASTATSNDDDDDDVQSSTEPDNDSSSFYCPIVLQGTFGSPLFRDPLATVPDSAIPALSHSLLPGAYSWHLHILVVPTSPTIKHACVLLPQSSTMTMSD